MRNSRFPLGVFEGFLSFAVIGMAIAAVFLLNSSNKSTQEITRTFRGTDAFFAFQVDFETKQLIDYVDRYTIPETGVGISELTERFDVLWSRVFSVDLENTDDALLNFPYAKETISALQDLLPEIEAQVFSLESGDSASANEIKRQLRDVLPLTQKLSLSAKDYNALVRTDFLRLQSEQFYLIIALILGTLLLGALGAYRLIFDRRRARTLNLKLEERVNARTRSLALANQEAELANETLELKIAEIEANQSILQEREERLSQAARLARLGYYSWNVIEERCDFCSEQHARSFGMTPDEYVAGVNAAGSQLFLICDEDKKLVDEKYSELRAGKTIEFEANVKAPNGFRRLRVIARPVFDEHGTVIKEVGTSLDVTEQRDMELQLFESQRMDSIGKLAGGMAHDFNNILAVILGNLELLQESPDDPDRQTLLSEAIDATFRGRDLTLSMLSFARRAPLAPTDLNLNQIVHGLEPMLRRTLPENIAFETSLAALWNVRADRSLLESALLNLTINARDAMPQGGKLTIETSNLQLEHGLGNPYENLEPGRYLMLAVTDTGHGISEGDVAKIFEPFFTTKEIANNSGLGLSMVQGFVKQSGGSIRVYSEVGVGTTFKLFFRASQDSISDKSVSYLVSATPVEAVGRVLLVEDEEAVRKVLKQRLERAGLTVTTAADSSSAEKAFKTQAPFDLMVTDIVMPGELQGPALAKKLRESDPDLPVIYLSGYPREAVVHGNGLRSEDIRLMKPVSQRELIDAVLSKLPKEARGPRHP